MRAGRQETAGIEVTKRREVNSVYVGHQYGDRTVVLIREGFGD